MKTENKQGALRRACLAILQDLQKLFADFCKFCVALVAALPKELLIPFIVIALALVERGIIVGVFDSWLQ